MVEEINKEIIPEPAPPAAPKRKDWIHPVFLQVGKLAGKTRSLSKNLSSRASRQIALLNLNKKNFAKNVLGTDILYFKKVVDIRPESAAAHCNLGMALLDRMRLNEAVFHLEKAAFLDFHQVRAYKGLAQAYKKLGRDDKAAEVMKKAAERNPDSKEAQDTLNSLKGKKGPTTNQQEE